YGLVRGLGAFDIGVGHARFDQLVAALVRILFGRVCRHLQDVAALCWSLRGLARAVLGHLSGQQGQGDRTVVGTARGRRRFRRFFGRSLGFGFLGLGLCGGLGL